MSMTFTQGPRQLGNPSPSGGKPPQHGPRIPGKPGQQHGPRTPGKPGQPSEDWDSKLSPAQKSMKKNLENQKSLIDKKIKKITLANYIRKIAIGFGPGVEKGVTETKLNDIPDDTRRNLLQTLRKLGINPGEIRNKNEIQTQLVDKGVQEYEFIVRKDVKIDHAEFARAKNINKDIGWDTKGIAITIEGTPTKLTPQG